MLFRLAPTPSGYLHTGNAFSFLLTAALKEKSGGRLLLRIDDLDAPRTRPQYLRDVFDSLEWLGIRWEEGPADSADFEKNWSQHTRMGLYMRAIERLKESGSVFACSCSRKEIPAGSPYPGNCQEKKIPLDTPNTSLRLKVPSGEILSFRDEHLGEKKIPLGKTTGCFIVRRKDGLPAYHLASLIDDQHFKVNYIVRGADLLESTAAQIYLAKQLNESGFLLSKFLHHDLITDENGDKLSKSDGALSLRHLRATGRTLSDLQEKLSPLLARYL